MRNGDPIQMKVKETQTARFSDGIYFDACPVRIPGFRQRLLAHAKKFEVPLEVDSSRSAYGMGDDGSEIRMRTAIRRGQLRRTAP